MKLGICKSLRSSDRMHAGAMMKQHYTPRYTPFYEREMHFPHRWVMRYRDNIFVGQRMSDVYNGKNAAILALLDNL